MQVAGVRRRPARLPGATRVLRWETHVGGGVKRSLICCQQDVKQCSLSGAARMFLGELDLSHRLAQQFHFCV